jgi:hypothetical protein
VTFVFQILRDDAANGQFVVDEKDPQPALCPGRLRLACM